MVLVCIYGFVLFIMFIACRKLSRLYLLSGKTVEEITPDLKAQIYTGLRWRFVIWFNILFRMIKQRWVGRYDPNTGESRERTSSKINGAEFSISRVPRVWELSPFSVNLEVEIFRVGEYHDKYGDIGSIIRVYAPMGNFYKLFWLIPVCAGLQALQNYIIPAFIQNIINKILATVLYVLFAWIPGAWDAISMVGTNWSVWFVFFTPFYFIIEVITTRLALNQLLAPYQVKPITEDDIEYLWRWAGHDAYVRFKSTISGEGDYHTIIRLIRGQRLW